METDLSGLLPQTGALLLTVDAVYTEALWQRAAWFMQSSVMRDLNVTPFSTGSVPSVAMVWWAVFYAALALFSGIQAFRKRAL